MLRMQHIAVRYNSYPAGSRSAKTLLQTSSRLWRQNNYRMRSRAQCRQLILKACIISIEHRTKVVSCEDDCLTLFGAPFQGATDHFQRFSLKKVYVEQVKEIKG